LASGRLREGGQYGITGQLRFRRERGGVPFAGSLFARRSVMPAKPSASIKHHFADLSDPRRREVTYPLINIVVIAICAVICGADDFVAIAKYGRTKRDWLGRFLDLSS